MIDAEVFEADLQAMEGQSAREALNGTASPEPRIRVVTLGELLTMEIPPREPFLESINGGALLYRQDTVMLHSKRGVGKTLFAMGLAHAAASGGRFLCYQARRPVVTGYIDGELPLATVQRRFAELQKVSDTEPPEGYLKIVTPDCQTLPLPNLATPAGQDAFAPVIDGIELLFIDNLSVLANHGRENESESWTPVQEWVLKLRRKGITVLLLHHSGKSGLQRGTSRREDILDLVINLAHPTDYEPDQGARFIVSFEKTRGHLGDAAKPFEARLKDGIWETRDVDDLNLTRAIEMREQKMSYAEIAQELSIAKSKVYRMLKGRE